MKKIKYITHFIIASTLLLLFTSCEDDPLLAPQIDSSDEGGSYGLLILNDGDELETNEDNPEIF